MSSLIKKIINDARIAIFRQGASKEYTIIKDEIPYEYTHFGVCEGDLIKRVKNNSGAYILMYFAPKGSKFPKHIHFNAEIILLISGKLKCSTPFRDEIIESTEYIKIDAEEWHLFEWLDDSELIIQYDPPFEKGWEGNNIS